MKDLGFPQRVTKVQLAELLALKYPSTDFSWEKVYLLRGKFSQQKRLERAIRTLFQVSV